VTILGIAFLSDASACVLRNGRLVAPVSEERLNCLKLRNGISQQALDILLRIAGNQPQRDRPDRNALRRTVRASDDGFRDEGKGGSRERESRLRR
jgi:hypothetical protein